MDVLLLIATLCSAQDGYTNAPKRALECQKWYLTCYDNKAKGKFGYVHDFMKQCILEKE